MPDRIGLRKVDHDAARLIELEGTNGEIDHQRILMAEHNGIVEERDGALIAGRDALAQGGVGQKGIGDGVAG